MGLTFVNEHQVIVDCFYDDAGFQVNQWYIVDTVTKTIPQVVVISSNNQKLEAGVVGFGRVVKHWKNNTSGNGTNIF